MAARRKLLNIKSVPGLNSSSQLEFISNRADELLALKIEQDKKCFESFYYLDDPEKVLGQGAHATICKCYKKEDEEKLNPFAVKIIRDSTLDEEKMMAHKKEYEITSRLDHKNIVKSHEYFYNELTKHIHIVMSFVDGKEVLDLIAE